MPDTITLSEAALALLRLRVSGQRVEVTDATREAYRELAAARLMYPVSGFVSGPEAFFRFTELGWHRREEWLSGSVPADLPQSF
jgi:hypothetical protein